MTGSSPIGTQADTNDGMASNGVATNGTLGMGAAGVNATGGAMAMPMERSTTDPDHGTIDMTAAQLKDTPTFHYAS